MGISRRDALAVQPRACGELLQWRLEIRNIRGSAPRVRGTPVTPNSQRQMIRFSPARAGNSHEAAREYRRHAVQPRACGELSGMMPPASSAIGSAPRVRGTPMD